MRENTRSGKETLLSVELNTLKAFFRKLEYLHNNPVAAGFCKYPEEYYYFSANFYKNGKDPFNMITHFIG